MTKSSQIIRASMSKCLKQLTRCFIIDAAGHHYEAFNSCEPGDVDECPRVTSGAKTGEDYDLCGPPIHAEQAAAALVPDDNQGGTAWLYGHTWMCGPCQEALTAKGIRRFIITGEAAYEKGK